MTRFLLMAVILAIGCGGRTKPTSVPMQVGWSQIVNDYRDDPVGSDAKLKDKMVTVYLPLRSYRIDGKSICAYHAIPGTNGALIFKCREVPGSEHSPLIVSGVCRGRIHDGIERANRINWYVCVEDCDVRELIPSR